MQYDVASVNYTVTEIGLDATVVLGKPLPTLAQLFKQTEDQLKNRPSGYGV